MTRNGNLGIAKAALNAGILAIRKLPKLGDSLCSGMGNINCNAKVAYLCRSTYNRQVFFLCEKCFENLPSRTKKKVNEA